MFRSFSKFLSIFLTFSLTVLSTLATGVSSASAAEVTIECGTYGFVTAVDGVIVGDDGMGYCEGQLIIPEGIRSISANAFYGLGNLRFVSIPSTVTFIGEGAFDYTTSLEGIFVEAGNPNYFSELGILYNKNKTVLIHYPSDYLESEFNIPSSVNRIRAGAFKSVANLQKVFIPQSVTNIEGSSEDSPFTRSSQLQEINVDSNNPNYSSLNGVLFNKSKTELIYFPRSNSITDYVMPGTVVNIRERAFFRNLYLQSVVIPNSVTTIGENAFAYAYSLSSVTMGSNVTTIEPFAFAYLIDLTEITLPNSVTSIGWGIFQGDTSLASVTLSSALTEIPDQAFVENYALTSITIPSGVETIGESAFYQARSLTSVTIPASVKRIGTWAFSWAWNISSVNFLGTYAPEVKYGAFSGLASGATVSFPEGAIGYCGSGTWKGLVLPGGGSPCPMNCTAITGAGLESTKDGWLISWDSFDYKTNIDNFNIFLKSGEESQPWYDNAAGYEIDTIPSVITESYFLPRDIIENLGRNFGFTSATLFFRKNNGQDGCYIISELGDISIKFGPTAAEILAELEKARALITKSAKSGAGLTLDSLKAAGVSGANSKNLDLINKEIALLPIESRNDLVQILKIVRKYEVLDILATPQSLGRQAKLLVEIGLIPAASKNKVALAGALKRLAPAERSNLAAVTAAIADKEREIKERAERLADLRARASERADA